MKLVFVVLLLVLVVAIAVVAAGRGTALGDVEPDRPPVGLPPEPLTPGDLHAVRLPTALRGYRMQEVDEVLDRLALELTARDTRIAELEAALSGTRSPSAPDRGAQTGPREEPSDG